MAQHP